MEGEEIIAAWWRFSHGAGDRSHRTRVLLSPPAVHIQVNWNATVGSNWLDKYLNCLKCCCFGFYTFSRGFSLLQRASFWVCWPVLPLGPAVQFLFVHGPVLCTSSQSPQDLLRLWIFGLRSLFCDFVNLSDAYLKLCIHFAHSREFDLSWSQFLFATLYVLCI